MRRTILCTLWTCSFLVGGLATGALPALADEDAETRIWAKGLTSHVESDRLDRETFANLAAETSPTVVNIFTTEEVRRRGLPLVPFSPLIPGLSHSAGNRTSLGTGFIIDEAGYIATNRHVIGSAHDIRVHLKGGETYPATVVEMVAARLDLILLKIDADAPLPVLAFGDSDELRVGEWVMAIGNSFGLGHTVTTGTVSNLIRITGVETGGDETHQLEVIQTDASINPGNSGGPLLNLDGHVIGMNTAVLRGGQNIGFALAINSIKRQLPTREQLAIHPAISHGATFVLLTTEEAETTYMDRSLAGRLKVERIAPRSPAVRGGLRVGDVMMAIDGHDVKTFTQLQAALVRFAPGEKIVWRIRRQDRTREVTLVGEPAQD